MSYKHSFMKKHDGHKDCTKTSFDRFFTYPSPKFKILAIPNVLSHRKSYEHVFMKKRDGQKVCTKSHAKPSFDRFFMHCLENSKY
ncbi:hypothetical protein BHM03_00060833 [Ensete ventricosum]|nr:hypothetical protein BHM03_00060833 [Ensete ventricosum]